MGPAWGFSVTGVDINVTSKSLLQVFAFLLPLCVNFESTKHLQLVCGGGRERGFSHTLGGFSQIPENGTSVRKILGDLVSLEVCTVYPQKSESIPGNMYSFVLSLMIFFTNIKILKHL